MTTRRHRVNNPRVVYVEAKNANWAALTLAIIALLVAVMAYYNIH